MRGCAGSAARVYGRPVVGGGHQAGRHAKVSAGHGLPPSTVSTRRTTTAGGRGRDAGAAVSACGGLAFTPGASRYRAERERGARVLIGSQERARSGLKGRWVPGLVKGELPAVRQANGGQ
jgi:hypothetical protein